MTHVVWQGGNEKVLYEARQGGKKVLSPRWIDASVKRGEWVDEGPYELQFENGGCSASRYLRDASAFSAATSRGSKRKRGVGSKWSTTSTPWWPAAPSSRWQKTAKTSGSSQAATVLYSDASSGGSARPTTTGPWSYVQRTMTSAVNALVSRGTTSTVEVNPPRETNNNNNTVIIIDDDDIEDDEQDDGKSRRGRGGSTSSKDSLTQQTGKMPPPPKVMDTAVLPRMLDSRAQPVSARDRYWDDPATGTNAGKRRHRGQAEATPALTLEAKLNEAASDEPTRTKPGPPPKKDTLTSRIALTVQASTAVDDDDDTDDDDENSPLAAKERPDDDDEAEKSERPLKRRRLSADKNEVEVIVIDDDSTAEKSQSPKPTAVSQAPTVVPSPANRRGVKQNITISASGVDDDMKRQLTTLSKNRRKGALRAQFADIKLCQKLRPGKPPTATHLVVPPERPIRTLKVLFALARGGTAIVNSNWVTESVAGNRWLDPPRFYTRFGPPRSEKTKLFTGSTHLHVLPSSIGAGDPSKDALNALIAAAGAKASNLRAATFILVGESFRLQTASSTVKAAAKAHKILNVKWLFDAIESNNPRFPTTHHIVLS